MSKIQEFVDKIWDEDTDLIDPVYTIMNDEEENWVVLESVDSYIVISYDAIENSYSWYYSNRADAIDTDENQVLANGEEYLFTDTPEEFKNVMERAAKILSDEEKLAEEREQANRGRMIW